MHCHHRPRLFGYLLVTNTELSVAPIASLMKKYYRFMALLYLKKTFDSGARERLFSLFKARLPSEAAKHASFLFYPSYTRTKGQYNIDLRALLKQGVPQGDPTSHFFNVYMDKLPSLLNSYGV